jgi:hypothetical protein
VFAAAPGRISGSRRKDIRHASQTGDCQREVPLDPLYSSTHGDEVISTLMRDGKRRTAERIMYGSLATIQEKTGDDPLKVFKMAVENVKPALEVKASPAATPANAQSSIDGREAISLPSDETSDAARTDLQRLESCGSL